MIGQAPGSMSVPLPEQQTESQDTGSAQQKFAATNPNVPGTQHLLEVVLQFPDWHCPGLVQAAKSGANEAVAAAAGATTEAITGKAIIEAKPIF